MTITTAKPKTSVIIPAYNEEDFILESTGSILQQTMSDLELIVIDDASTDRTRELLDTIDDPRLRVVHHETNQGVAVALERGVNEARGTYIAIIGADEISLPNRLADQVKLLDACPEVGIVGGQGFIIDEYGNYVDHLPHYPETDLEIRWQILLGCPFLTTTTTFRKSVTDTYNLNHDPHYKTAQDYDLWSKILRHSQGANVPVMTGKTRYRLKCISNEQFNDQLSNHDQISYNSVRYFLPDLEVDINPLAKLHLLWVAHYQRLPELEAQRVDLVNYYLNLFDHFAAKHKGHHDLRKVRHTVAVDAARMLLVRPILRPDSAKLWKRILRVEPLLPVLFSHYAACVVGRHIRKKYCLRNTAVKKIP